MVKLGLTRLNWVKSDHIGSNWDIQVETEPNGAEQDQKGQHRAKWRQKGSYLITLFPYP